MAAVPPVAQDVWSYGGGYDFHVEASGNNRHRRATVPELKAIYDGSDASKDRTAHWYEAQLLHYGLPPSKTKGTAKMRLFEAVNKGNLAVPPHILKIESDLKKEWAKREREAKQALKKALEPVAVIPPKRKATRKRKADETQTSLGNNGVNLSFSTDQQGNIQIGLAVAAGPPQKKAKPTRKAPGEESQKPAPKAKETKPKPTPAPRTKQTARRGGAWALSSRQESVASPPPLSRTNVARRGRPFSGRGGVQAMPGGSDHGYPFLNDSYDDPLPPYPGSPMSIDSPKSNSNGDVNDSNLLPPLGLLNGRYAINCLDSSYDDMSENSGLILTLDGNALWGSFEIGPVFGILRLDERPWKSSFDRLTFDWRGEDSQGGDHFGTNDGSSLKFLGNGQIQGQLAFYGDMLDFDGERVSGQGTRSEISAVSMRQQWEQRGR
ncbi:hypothetical protein B0T26DRAFT_736230 [Lasiosphaeria miniovina]|uniref:Uncharacterized protein n=1 Tax=Lasiosphaeria miniovina TaxID=1954250 RepID=A0AA40BFH8_9PEZI|nr:uncharacterized protein B0T26DRAFT_736230 [Lasiosphaeria miniovina]KAK0733275.1 hypothetical protein B0T26DRAFT_736230 [Lasiosphaeria miniovina]